jgi:ribonucleoside-diphosphate reductase alpha chain
MSVDNLDILSKVVIHMKYAKHLTEKRRRETFDEIVERNKQMHLKKFKHLPDLCKEIECLYEEYVKTKKVLPSMRSMQFAGKPIEVNNARLFNCSYLPVDCVDAFSETMFLLLCGCGVGFSVQSHHVKMLPEIIKPRKSRKFLVSDDLMGWADAIKALLRSYMCGKSMPRFDFSDIRPKGTPLKTAGGLAPGPVPLSLCLNKIQAILDEKEEFSKLTTLECHDIMCHIADSVMSAGIRRSATISFFDMDDDDMLTCKYGSWWETNPQRGRANNSVVIVRHRVNKSDFMGLWEKIKASGSGEPGIYLTNNKDIMANPCNELSLKANQMCNLTEINLGNISDQQDLNNRAKAASFIGTLQASYTDFHYLRDEWKEVSEKDSLIGVGCTGIASGCFKELSLVEAAKCVNEENERVAGVIGINKASRTNCIKPSGSSSIVLGCSSGIHAWHSKYYIRRVRVGKDEPIYGYLVQNHPELLEDDILDAKKTAIITVPVEAPDGSITREESAIDLLERVKLFHNDWIRPGHRKGDNTNNVSATVSIKDDEWDDVAEWMWSNRNSYNGLSILPHSDHTYTQAPFEEITKEEFEELSKHLTDIDLSNIIEEEDGTDLSGEIACSGGSCEIR